jgi:hypothetical protein
LIGVYISRARFFPPAADGRRKPFGSKSLRIPARHRAAEQENGPRPKFFAGFSPPHGESDEK